MKRRLESLRCVCTKFRVPVFNIEDCLMVQTQRRDSNLRFMDTKGDLADAQNIEDMLAEPEVEDEAGPEEQAEEEEEEDLEEEKERIRQMLILRWRRVSVF